ncbi:MAG TPA: hypothetical protein VF712_14520 [Thermoleophilaceae bacterium]
MREPRNQFAKIADTIAGTMRRRQRGREPRVLLYGADGRPRTLSPSDDAHPAIVEAAEKLVVLATGRSQPDEAAE